MLRDGRRPCRCVAPTARSVGAGAGAAGRPVVGQGFQPGGGPAQASAYTSTSCGAARIAASTAVIRPPIDPMLLVGSSHCPAAAARAGPGAPERTEGADQPASGYSRIEFEGRAQAGVVS
jgi:hypothetical protein